MVSLGSDDKFLIFLSNGNDQVLISGALQASNGAWREKEKGTWQTSRVSFRANRKVPNLIWLLGLAFDVGGREWFWMHYV